MDKVNHRAHGPLPPALFLAGLISQVTLHVTIPVLDVVPAAWRLSAIAAILGGFWVMAVADGRFKVVETVVNPFGEPSVLVTTGPFRYSRNPMYLGMLLVQLGVAVALGSLTPFAVVPAFAWLLTHRFIAMEEAKMERVFGEAYAHYRRRVPRWI